MTTKRKKISRKPWLVAALILVLAGGAMLVVHRHSTPPEAATGTNNPTGTIDYTPPPKADNDANETRKTSSNPGSTLNNSSTPVANFSVQINPVVSNGNVHVGTQVDGITTGSCSLTATKPGQSTLQFGTQNVVQDVNVYDCGVFNVPVASFPSKGSWQLTLTATSGGKSASTNATVRID